MVYKQWTHMGFEPLSHLAKMKCYQITLYGPYFTEREINSPYTSPQFLFVFYSATMVRLFSHLQSTPLLAVTSPPPHLLYFIPQQSLVMVCLKDTPKIACSFFFKIFGGPSLTVSLLWQGNYVVNQKFLWPIIFISSKFWIYLYLLSQVLFQVFFQNLLQKTVPFRYLNHIQL